MPNAFAQTNTPPGLLWKGTRDPATVELATRIDARWLNGLKQPDPKLWWLPLVDIIPTEEGVETVKLPIDFEDLSIWQEATGQRVARGVKPLQAATIHQKPWYKDRDIPSKDIKRNAFGSWPDRLSAMMLSSRRMMGIVLRNVLFASGATGTGSKYFTYQGDGMTQAIIARSGHISDPTEPGSLTFGNLHTGADQAASATAVAVRGATAFNTSGWENIQADYLSRPGPGGVPLDMHVHFVAGGSRMKPKFKRIFKRVLTLDETGVAAVTNINADTMLEVGEEPTIPIVSAWLDQHPYALANPTKDQFWTFSMTYNARGIGIIAENGGAPTVKVLDIGSEYEIQNDRIYVKGDMSMNAGGAFPHVWDEWRET
jgi:hypothetical protein